MVQLGDGVVVVDPGSPRLAGQCVVLGVQRLHAEGAAGGEAGAVLVVPLFHAGHPTHRFDVPIETERTTKVE